MQKKLKRLGVIFIASLCILTVNGENNNKNKPNIIYILADDLGYGDLSCYGQQKFSTPNIDKLASEGMLFTQHYSGSTVCAPSRSTLMTGLHTGHTPIRGNKEIKPEGQAPLTDSIVTIAELLKDVGYTTGAFGKWGLGFPGSEGDPNKQGFDEFYGYNCQRIGHNYYPYHMWSNQEKIILKENEGRKEGTYGPDDIHEKALKFLNDNKDNPFFMYYPSIIPHAELFATEKYMKKHRGKYFPEKNYKGIDDGPYYKVGGYGSQPEAHAAFAALINILDDHVGEIIEKLYEYGIEDNTLVIFTSDNGPHMEGGADPEFFNSNGEFRGFKRDLYEGGIRVPMIAWWPGKIKEGQVSNHISAFWDVMPTIAELAGFEAPQNIDGISFLPTLLGDNDQFQHEYLYWEFNPMGGRQALRMGKWKAVRYNLRKNKNVPIELYNLEEDPGEQVNVASKFPELVVKAKKIFQQARSESKDFPLF